MNKKMKSLDAGATAIEAQNKTSSGPKHKANQQTLQGHVLAFATVAEATESLMPSFAKLAVAAEGLERAVVFVIALTVMLVAIGVFAAGAAL